MQLTNHRWAVIQLTNHMWTLDINTAEKSQVDRNIADQSQVDSDRAVLMLCRESVVFFFIENITDPFLKRLLRRTSTILFLPTGAGRLVCRQVKSELPPTWTQ